MISVGKYLVRAPLLTLLVIDRLGIHQSLAVSDHFLPT
jgi:hypothetical protein